jgi:plastocyanin
VSWWIIPGLFLLCRRQAATAGPPFGVLAHQLTASGEPCKRSAKQRVRRGSPPARREVRDGRQRPFAAAILQAGHAVLFLRPRAVSGKSDNSSHSHSRPRLKIMRRAKWMFAVVCVLAAAPALADDPSFSIVLKNNQFVPSEVQIPAGVKVKLVVRNENSAVSEFESTQFHREKVVPPGQEITVFVGPLDPGSYEFFDDFHPETRGHLVVK